MKGFEDVWDLICRNTWAIVTHKELQGIPPGFFISTTSNHQMIANLFYHKRISKSGTDTTGSYDGNLKVSYAFI